MGPEPKGEKNEDPSVFPPERAIAGILHCNQRWPPEKQEKGKLALSFYKSSGLTQT